MGKVYLVGAGPGAPDLLTLRAAEILDRAELVFHDALVHPQTLALAAHARKILVGKRSGRHSTAELGVSLTRRGLARLVVFVTPRAGSGERENDWAASVIAADTAVIYMGA